MISPWSGPNSGPMHPSVTTPEQVDRILRETMAQVAANSRRRG